MLYVRDSEAGGAGESQWVQRGGWRLWIAPERSETTYVPDNDADSDEARRWSALIFKAKSVGIFILRLREQQHAGEQAHELRVVHHGDRRPLGDRRRRD